jgi:cyclophilin family peptidyl-prolyl cis-trans isomerase
MNQTTWIISGGVLVIALALALFSFSGQPAPRSNELAPVTVPVTEEPATPTPESTASVPAASAPKNTMDTTQEPIIVLHTSMGEITIKLFKGDTPKTVENFLKLAQDGFYNGVRFHRVIKDFMIQSGDPLSKDDAQMGRWGTGGPGYTFADEVSKKKLVAGSLAMANAGPNTNGSQFFIVTKDSTPWLDGKHTNFGEVISGMDVVMKIDATPTAPGDRPLTPVTITRVEVK